MRTATMVVAVLCAACSSNHGAAPADGPTSGDGAAPVDGAVDALVADAPSGDAMPADASTGSSSGPDSARIAVGYAESCAIHHDGTLWCWGAELPGGSASTVPAQVGSDTGWTEVAISEANTCAIDGGALYCWGVNSSSYILGTGDTAAHLEPVQIGSATAWTAIALSLDHACGIVAGALYCWGANQYGAAGSGAPGSIEVPTQLGSDTDWAAIAAGGATTCGLRGSGSGNTLWCWGYNVNGSYTAELAPTQVGSAANWMTIGIELDSFNNFYCGLATDGTAWCWGYDYSDTPEQISADTDYTAIAPGFGYAILGGMLSEEGSAFGSWVPIGSGHTWRAVAAESTFEGALTWSAHECALDSTDAVWCWGTDAYGDLGIGTQAELSSDTPIGSASDWFAVSMQQGTLTCGLRGSGDAYCWGTSPGIGNGSSAAVQVPAFVGAGYADIAAGAGAACGVKRDGSLWCWGVATVTGFAGNVYVPTQIGSATDWTTVALYDRGCGIRSGALYCWGDYAGDGTSAYHGTPIQVGSATDWTAISLGQYVTCGIAGGGLYCWSAEAGATELAPTQVGSATTWLSVDLKDTSFVTESGLQTDHSWWEISPDLERLSAASWSYGGGDFGVSAGMLYGPVGGSVGQLGSATDWVYAVGAGERCGIHTSGVLTCLGTGLFGELGTGTAWVTNPTQVAGP